jgi:carbamoyltransferase
MITLGLNGGIDFPYENEFNFQSADLHDSAAALFVDGKIVAAIEEERLNRIKHSNKSSIYSAAQFVLETSGISIQEVDKICYYMTEDMCNRLLKFVVSAKDFAPIRKRITRKFAERFGCNLNEERLYFVPHHIAHAVSTYAMSGFDESLILAVDKGGDGISGLVLEAKAGSMKILDTLSIKNSLGKFYTDLIEYLGYTHFDEYKVMGLAPYGDPKAYRDIFKTFYRLMPDGRFETNSEYYYVLNKLDGIPREKGEEFTRVHKDIAASLQEALEVMVFHLVKHHKNATNLKKLCLAGGVAQNCTLNGKILYSGMFEDVFVQPASYDAGSAIGAALFGYYNETKKKIEPNSRLEHVYWGTDIGPNEKILEVLKCWQTFIDFQKDDNIARKAAGLLADGSVIGWVQGKSEFGPRALGNRSILGDPRPPENKDIINAMVKKREAFRPFAPSILEEYVEDYYVVPGKYKKFPFMTFVLNVKKEKQKILGAVTHVDGTARIQTVSKETNPKYWQLIDEFRKITGIPVLLNTSFNNNVEPIVDSIEDAIVCFLTTKINYLVVGDYLIKKKEVNQSAYREMVLSIPLHIQITHARKPVSSNRSEDIYEIRDNFLTGRKVDLGGDVVLFPNLSFGVVKSKISRDSYLLLTQADGTKSLGELLDLDKDTAADGNKIRGIVEELINLWTLRLIKLKPKEKR